MKWITRERPKIDRIACPWLIARFIDAEPEFLFVAKDQVLATARALGATPFDIPGVELSHEGERCTFDTIMRVYKLAQPALAELAVIVRGADTGVLDLAPQAPGLLAVSLGLSVLYQNDHEMLKHGMVVYDALYAWICHARGETHDWAHVQIRPVFRP
ncbi:MAG: chromate resistance protein [Rhodospirillaceae bacterium]|nr:chromate resistance protein [Rhodospirillaceae bacterium]